LAYHPHHHKTGKQVQDEKGNAIQAMESIAQDDGRYPMIMKKKRCKYCYVRTADKTLGKGDLCPDCYEYQRQEELLAKIQFAQIEDKEINGKTND